MRTMRFALLLPLLLCVGALLAGAQEVSDYREGHRMVREFTGVVSAGAARVRVDSDLGSVRIEPSSSGEFSYRILVRVTGEDERLARRRLDELVINASRSGDDLLFTGEVVNPENLQGFSAEFELSVPRTLSRIEVWTGSGDVHLAGIAGSATLVTHGGRITVRDLGGPLEAETRRGDIVVGRVSAGVRLITLGGAVRVDAVRGDLVVKTSGGEVQIGQVTGRVQAETGGGSVRVGSTTGDVVTITSAGNIDLGRIGGHVSAATAGGSIRVAGAGAGAHCETAAGPIVLRGVRGPIRAITLAGNIRAEILRGFPALAEFELRTLRGDVVVFLPEALPMTVRALVDNPFGSAIRSEFPLRIVREFEELGRQLETAEGDIGGGGSILKIRALGGRIAILKARNPNPGAPAEPPGR